MEMNEKKSKLVEMLDSSISKVREMVETNTIVGQPISTPDGVTLIPINKMSIGLGGGGTDYGASADKFGGGAGAGIKVEPVAFLVVKDGVTRMRPVSVPAATTVDRVIELVPEVMDRVQSFVDKKKANSEF